MLDKEVIEKLKQPLEPSRVKHRQGGGGMSLAYLKGHNVIDQANEVFGWGAWGYDIIMVELCNVVAENGEVVGGYYAARVRLTVRDCMPITEEGVCPIQEGRNPRAKIDAHDMARKGAVTDAMKRAFRCYGDQFGNSLYDTDLIDGQPGTEKQPAQQYRQPAPNQPTRAAVTQQAAPPVNRPAPAPQAPVTPQPARPTPDFKALPQTVVGSPAPANKPLFPVEDDDNFKFYRAKIHAAKSLKELSDIGPTIKKNVYEAPVLEALRLEHKKAEAALTEKVNAKIEGFVGAGK